MMKQPELKELTYQVFLDVARYPGTYHSKIYERLGLKDKTLLSAALHCLVDEKKLLETEEKAISGASVLTFYVADPSMSLDKIFETLGV